MLAVASQATAQLICHFGSSPPLWHSADPGVLAAHDPPALQAIDFKQFFGCQPSGTSLDTYLGMKAVQDHLVRHLVIAVALKLAVLAGLWWAFVRDERVVVDVERAAAHLGAVVDATPLTSAPSGAQP